MDWARVLRAFGDGAYEYRHQEGWWWYGFHRAADEIERQEREQTERRAARLGAPDPLHPDGRCTCNGEGACEWCIRVEGCAEDLKEAFRISKGDARRHVLRTLGASPEEPRAEGVETAGQPAGSGSSPSTPETTTEASAEGRAGLANDQNLIEDAKQYGQKLHALAGEMLRVQDNCDLHNARGTLARLAIALRAADEEIARLRAEVERLTDPVRERLIAMVVKMVTRDWSGGSAAHNALEQSARALATHECKQEEKP